MASRWRSSSTSETGSSRPALAFAVCLAFAAAVAGCTVLDVFDSAPAPSPSAAKARPRKPAPAPVAWMPVPPPSRTAFDHKFHLGLGPVCADCHEGADTNEKAAMPTLEFCMDCHTDLDAPKPKEKTVAAFLDAAGKSPQWSRVTAQAPDIVFSHAVHAAKKVECAQCHLGIEASVAVSKDFFMDMDACMKCHEAKGAKNECSTCHKAGAASVAVGKGPYWPPANHDKVWRETHGAVVHLEAPRNRGERCDDCHGKPQFPVSGNCESCHANTKPSNHDVAWRDVHGSDVLGDPQSVAGRCGICHDSTLMPAAGRCDVCHATTKPANHERLWRELHGQAVRRDPETVTARCAFCHEQSGFPLEAKCTGCHQTERPRDHSQSWCIGRGHGLAASMDRGRCAACHTTDTCSACHATVEPRSHRGNWGAPRDRHCVGCHLPLRESSPDGCAVCHESTPSHASAPPLPSSPPHRPDANCRQCHFGPKNLKHTDNGLNCVICHR